MYSLYKMNVGIQTLIQLSKLISLSCSSVTLPWKEMTSPPPWLFKPSCSVMMLTTTKYISNMSSYNERTWQTVQTCLLVPEPTVDIGHGCQSSAT